MLKTNENLLRASVIHLKTKRVLECRIIDNNDSIKSNKEKINNIQNNDIKYIVEYIRCLEERVQVMENIISNTFSIKNDKECENEYIH